VVYLVRSSRTYARIRSLTTGTFNLVVKDRIAIRQSGANSVQANAHKANPTVLETLQTYVAAQDPVNASVPQNFHVISTMGIRGGGAGLSFNQKPKSRQTLWFVIPNRRSRRGICFCLPGAQTRATVWPSASKALISAHAEAEDRKLRKDLAFGGPCLEGTLQKPTRCFRIKPRGRGD
jgi:hypothetical protein